MELFLHPFAHAYVFLQGESLRAAIGRHSESPKILSLPDEPPSHSPSTICVGSDLLCTCTPTLPGFLLPLSAFLFRLPARLLSLSLWPAPARQGVVSALSALYVASSLNLERKPGLMATCSTTSSLIRLVSWGSLNPRGDRGPSLLFVKGRRRKYLLAGWVWC